MKHVGVVVLLAASALLTPAARAGVASDLRDWYVLPAVASSGGAYGTYFRTDVTLVNPYVADSVSIRIWLLRNDKDNTESPVADVRLQPGETVLLRDVVQSLFGESGGASLVLYSSDGLAFSCSARTYTGSPGTNGFAGNGHHWWNQGRASSMTPGLRNGFGYRTNLGVVSTSPIPLTVAVNVYGSAGALGTRRITLPPYGRFQFPVSDIAPPFEDGYAVWTGVTSSDDAHWIPFATVIDNTSGDSVYVDDVYDRAYSAYDSRYDLEGEWRGTIGAQNVTALIYQSGPRLDVSFYDTATGAPIAVLAGYENKGSVEASGTPSRLQCLADAVAVSGSATDSTHLTLTMAGSGCFATSAPVTLQKYKSFPTSDRESPGSHLRSPGRVARAVPAAGAVEAREPARRATTGIVTARTP